MKDHAPLSFLFGSILSFIVFPAHLHAQGMRMEKGETATCIIKTGKVESRSTTGKTYQVEPNVIGLFKQVSNIIPSEQASIEIIYPSAKAGEKVVVIVLDGGKLDNGKGVKEIFLNSLRKCSFNFQVGKDVGIYRLLLRKGNDAKIVQLWVGAELATVRN